MEAHPYYPHTALLEVKGVKEAQTLKVQVKISTVQAWLFIPKITGFVFSIF